jgi:Fe2+ transport system protein FeoA
MAINYFSLAELRLNQQARLRMIHSIRVEFELLRMGILPGAVLRLARRTPGGALIAIQCEGMQIALRKELAKLIEIERLD